MISRFRRYTLKEAGLAFAFLAPSLIIFTVFFYLPFFRLVDWGRYKSERGGLSYRYVGLQQYRDILTGPEFTDGLKHSVLFVLYTVPAGLVLGVLLAVAAHRQLKGIKVFQAIFSSTLASSVAVSSVLFLFLFNPAVGFFQVGWKEDPDMALFAAALPSIWQNLGLAFVIVLAGLQAVPEEVMEAARLDGYGPTRRLLRITLPLISPVLLFLVVVLVIFGFQAFAQIQIVTNGGPAGASETLVFKISRQSQNYGAGAVLSIGLFAVTLVVTFLQFVLLERRVHYGDE
ncbi:MAG TPA: sugar ABC transporter permease [Acidimicrobiales bacterium]|nr:sugar ABC transporter permease [Acidimicrobiales bacterium]HMS90280.1 sugar ABC transporter permease [Acidimicrobiales bacterium]HRA33380.1 sugar ABC transporter permease [Acidimicrobiales bacterium]